MAYDDESMHDLELRLHSPRRAEIIIKLDKPWEDSTMFDPVVMKDDNRTRCVTSHQNILSSPYSSSGGTKFIIATPPRNSADSTLVGSMNPTANIAHAQC